MAPATRPLPVAVLVSGRGTNLRAIVDAIDEGRCDARIVGVVADREKSDALHWARDRGFATDVVRPLSYVDRAAWDAGLRDAVAALEPEVVVLAGFMKIVGAAFLARFGGRTLNVHPSLLPAFPGMDAPEQTIASGARVGGCTVHLVDEGVDTGPILAQAVLRVRPDDDAAALHQRIQALEHRLLPQVLDWIATGALILGALPRFVGPFPDDDALLSPPLPT